MFVWLQVMRLLNNRVISELEMVSLFLGFSMVRTNIKFTVCPNNFANGSRMMLSRAKQGEASDETSVQFDLDKFKSNKAIQYLLRPVGEHPWLARMTCVQSERQMVKSCSIFSKQATQIDSHEAGTVVDMASDNLNGRVTSTLAMQAFDFPAGINPGDAIASSLDGGNKLFNGPWKRRTGDVFVRWTPVLLMEDTYQEYMESKCWLCLGYYYDQEEQCFKDQTGEMVDFEKENWAYEQQLKFDIFDPHNDALVELQLFLRHWNNPSPARIVQYIKPEFDRRSNQYVERFQIERSNFEVMWAEYLQIVEHSLLDEDEKNTMDELPDLAQADSRCTLDSLKEYDTQRRAVAMLHERLLEKHAKLTEMATLSTDLAEPHRPTREEEINLKHLLDATTACQVQAAIVGMAGSGKSHCINVLMAIQQGTLGTKQMFARVAPTGQAAAQLGPSSRTIYNYCEMGIDCISKMQFGTDSMRDFERRTVIIVGEAFYVDVHALQELNRVCQKFPLHPLLKLCLWGGRDIVIDGDPLQLENPSACDHGLFLGSKLFLKFRIYVIQENVRQQKDAAYFELLGDLRIGKNLGKFRQFLLERQCKLEHSIIEDNITTLPTGEVVLRTMNFGDIQLDKDIFGVFTRLAHKDKYNSHITGLIPGPMTEVEAVYARGTQPVEDSLVPTAVRQRRKKFMRKLILKRGAKYVHLVNTGRAWHNGTRCFLKSGCTKTSKPSSVEMVRRRAGSVHPTNQ